MFYLSVEATSDNHVIRRIIDSLGGNDYDWTQVFIEFNGLTLAETAEKVFGILPGADKEIAAAIYDALNG